MEKRVMNIVENICSHNISDCRGLSLADEGRKLLDFANVPNNANIQEIPLCWDNQVVILFLMPNDDNYYSLFAGIGNDGKFYFELSITGKLLTNGYFDFYDEEEILNIDYFKNY